MAEQTNERLRQMRTLMGDTNNDGVVSAKELMDALTNGKSDAIDEVAKIAFGAELQRYTVLSAMTKSDRVKREAARETRDNLEEITRKLLENLQASGPQSDPDMRLGQEILSSVRRIEIPRDIAAMAKAVVGDGSTMFFMPEVQDAPEGPDQVPLVTQTIARNDAVRSAVAAG